MLSSMLVMRTAQEFWKIELDIEKCVQPIVKTKLKKTAKIILVHKNCKMVS